MKKIVGWFLIFGLSIALNSCSKGFDFLKKKQENVVAEVQDEKLYIDDLDRCLNLRGLSEADSLLLVDTYVKSWVSEKLMYNKALGAVSDMEEIDSLVENYRRSLVIYEYELQLVNEHLANQLSESQMRVYYKENSALFTQSEPLLKGMLVVAYSDIPELQVIESLVESPSEDNIDLISSVCVKNAAKFDYFSDKWVPLSEVQKGCPVAIKEKDLQTKKMTVMSDSMYTAFLYLEDYKNIGDLQPFEYAKDRIKSILTEQGKNDYLNSYRKSLYEQAVQKGDAKRYK